MGAPFFLVDSFTDVPFAGNPAGVVLVDSHDDRAWMQAIAAEVNAAETAFVTPDRRLTWFTPTTEVDLCGHATLAAAHALGGSEPIRFQTRVHGELTATPTADGLELDFPADQLERRQPPPELLEALGVMPVASLHGREDWLLELADEESVRELQPDFGLLRRTDGARGVIVTAAAEPGAAYDVVSRFFAPAVGIDEDPVTGSAHTSLAVHWAPRLGQSFTGRQVSARGGTVQVRLDGDRVRLTGRAVTVFRGEVAV